MFGRSKSVVGLDIGSSAVKAVELKAVGKGYKVAAFGNEPIPPDSIVDGAIMDGGGVVAEPGFYEAFHRPTGDAPAAEPVRVAAAEPVRPPTPSLPPVVSSADTDALRALEGLLVAVLGARAQRERASLS